MKLKARFEFKIQDSWIGVFWKRSEERFMEDATRPEIGADGVCREYWPTTSRQRLDVWICVLPWVPLHVVAVWGKRVETVDEEIARMLSDVDE